MVRTGVVVIVNMLEQIFWNVSERNDSVKHLVTPFSKVVKIYVIAFKDFKKIIKSSQLFPPCGTYKAHIL
jgi:hypothetical protein